MTKQPQTLRTCSACGQKKPLVAFLELAGTKGHTYGDICAACRSAGLGRKKPSENEPADRSGGTSRLQIDNKAKVQIEADKKEQTKQVTERDYEEKLKKENSETEKTNETHTREEIEKRYREEYLEQKKQSAAKVSKNEKPNPGAPQEVQRTQTQSFYQEKARVTKEFQTQTEEQQLGKKTTGLSAEYVNRYVSSTGRSAESLFGQFLGQFLRNHIQAKNPQQKTGTNNPGSEAKKPQTASPTSKEKPQEASKTNEENVAVEFVKNNLKLR
jgi:hypothetical protein